MELWQLKQRQGMPLGYKLMLTHNRIKVWHEHYKGQVYVAFSGGKDSTVLLDLVRRLYPDVPAVFCDTGLEFPEIREFVKTIDNVTWIKPKIPFNKVIEKYGYPVISKEQSQFISQYQLAKSEKTKETRLKGNKYGRGKISNKWLTLLNAPFKVSDRCCDIMKKTPAKNYEKETGRKPFIGTMAEESQLRQQKLLKSNCNSFDSTRPTSTPIAFWTEKDIWEYIKQRKLPYSKIYDMGYERTGCMFCMFGVHLEKGENRFQKMSKTHPKQYEYCIKSLGCGKVMDYINVDYKPRVTLFEQ